MKILIHMLSLSTVLACASLADAESIRGTLKRGDDAMVVYSFKLQDESQVEIRMISEEIDSYLFLFAVQPDEGAGRFQLVAENDDDNSSLNSLIDEQLPPGDYRIVARSLGGEPGPFELIARRYRGGPPRLLVSALGDMAKSRPAPAAGDAAGMIFGERPAYAVSIPVSEAGRLQVDVLAHEDWDAILMLEAPDGTTLDVNDDMFSLQHSRIRHDVRPGNHTAWVTMSDPDAQNRGTFLLNATFRKIEDQADLPLRVADDDAEEIRSLITMGGGADSWVGREVPGFDLPTVDGDARVSLEGLRGRLVLIDFWEPWCGPCLHTMPHLERLHRELGESHEITVVGISSEEIESVRGVIERLETTYPQLHDPASGVSDAYGVASIPRLVLVGRDGVAVGDFTGTRTFEQLRAAVEEAHSADPGD
jgi:thiol-disulfide isomerase/thioredoxin